jgi:hypothetical protein
MNKSDTIGKLAAALSKAQAAMEPAKKESRGNFGAFADLGDVIDAIRKVSTPNGLSFSQFPVGDSAGMGVTTILMHESGEWLSDTIYLPISDEMSKRNGAQLAGINITYLRRYALAAAFGVYADLDTDGNQGTQPARNQQPATQPVRTNPAPAASKPVVNPNPPTFEGVPVKANRDTFFELANKHGLQKEAAKIASAHAKTQDWATATAELNEQVKSFA